MKRIVLVGSPNVGKSVIFNALTGKNAAVANYPGSTVDYMAGKFSYGGRSYQVIDTPGIYSLDSLSEDEAVTRSVMESAPIDLIVHVADAKHIRRMLPLTLYFMEKGMPVILVLNMMDEARALGVRIQIGRLAKMLGIPVVAAAAAQNIGLSEIKKEIQSFLSSPGAAAVFTYEREDEEKFKSRRERADQYVARVAGFGSTERRRSQRVLCDLTRRPLTGLPILAMVLYFGLYQLVGVLGAGVLVDAVHTFFELYVTPYVERAVAAAALWDWLARMLVGEYGVYSIGVRYAVSIVLPIVGVFFFVFAILEDSGYLPRMALLMDRTFKCFGLNGKAAIPVTLGLGCGTMAVLVTRTLGTKRERLLLSFLLALAIPCSAQLGVIMGVLSQRENLLGLWCGYLAFVFVAAGWLGNLLLQGKSSPFCMELPPLRMPAPRQILQKTSVKFLYYAKEIIPVFILTSVVLSVLDLLGALERFIGLLAPCVRLLGLPDELAGILLLGFFRRDYGAAGLYELCEKGALTDAQLLTAAVVLTLCMPCVAQVMMMVKERGMLTTAVILALTVGVAFLSGLFIRCALLPI